MQRVLIAELCEDRARRALESEAVVDRIPEVEDEGQTIHREVECREEALVAAAEGEGQRQQAEHPEQDVRIAQRREVEVQSPHEHPPELCPAGDIQEVLII